MKFEVVPKNKGREPDGHPLENYSNAVKFLTASGMNQAQIASVLSISAGTIKKYYSEDLEAGKDQVDAYVTGKLFELIANGDRSSIQYYLSRKGGFSEKIDVGVSGFNVTVSRKSDGESGD